MFSLFTNYKQWNHVSLQLVCSVYQSSPAPGKHKPIKVKICLSRCCLLPLESFSMKAVDRWACSLCSLASSPKEGKKSVLLGNCKPVEMHMMKRMEEQCYVTGLSKSRHAGRRLKYSSFSEKFCVTLFSSLKKVEHAVEKNVMGRAH
jgi:hypothetical protein